MYIVPVGVKNSPIHGKGVFAKEDIRKGQVVWQFTPGHDIKMSPKDFEALDKNKKLSIQPIAYSSPTSGQWVMPPPNDPACYTNHSNSNNLSAKFDAKLSDEPYFIANRDIKAGEELTNDYREFDKIAQQSKLNWLNT